MNQKVQVTDETSSIILEVMQNNEPIKARHIRRRNDNMECIVNGLEVKCQRKVGCIVGDYSIYVDVYLQKETGFMFISMSSGDISDIENSGGVIDG